MDAGYAFVLKNKHAKMLVMIGCVEIDIIIDSESDSNVIDRALWEVLKLSKIKCTLRMCKKKLYPYTCHRKPLQTMFQGKCPSW